MQIHINRDGQNYGPYTLDEVRQYLAAGNILLTDLAWHEGAAGWIPLGQVPGVGPAARPSAASSPAPGPARPVLAAAAPPAIDPSAITYAGFWKRVVAYVIDSFLLSVVLWIVMFVLSLLMVGAISTGGEAGAGAALGLVLLMQVLMIVLMWLYFAIMESSAARGTIGKQALGIVVTDMDGRRIGFGRASGRFFGKILSSIVLAVGFLMAGFTARKQGLHDMLASTLVVNKDPADTRMPLWGILLLILFGVLPVIAVIGILLAIAIPAYHDYATRAKVSEAINSASTVKIAVAEFVTANNRLPQQLEDLGLGATPANAEFAWVDGVLVVTVKRAGAAIDGGSVGLELFQRSDGQLVWRCGNAEPPADATDVAAGDSAASTSLESRFLPASCR